MQPSDGVATPVTQHKPGCGLFIGNRPDGVPTCTCGVGAPAPAQQSVRVPCRGCTSEIYCEMNGCKSPRTDGVAASGDQTKPHHTPMEGA